jgi:hypothetical protein
VAALCYTAALLLSAQLHAPPTHEQPLNLCHNFCAVLLGSRTAVDELLLLFLLLLLVADVVVVVGGALDFVPSTGFLSAGLWPSGKAVGTLPFQGHLKVLNRVFLKSSENMQ